MTKSPPTAPPEPSNHASGWLVAAEVGLIVLIFFLAGGDPAPNVNEPHYLCRLKHAADPNYCLGDLFLESPDAHLTFVAAFAWLTNWLSLPALAWAGRLATWVALAWAWRRLSWTIVPRPLFATLGAAVAVVGIAKGNFAGEWLIGGFEAKGIAYVFVLLGLRAWIVGRWNSAWVHLGIASAWHALVGGWSVVILLGLWATSWRREVSLRSLLPGLALGGTIALLGVVPALLLNAGEPAETTAQAAEIYVFERLPHHLAPLHKSPQWIATQASQHLQLVALMVGMLAIRMTHLRWNWRALRDDPAGKLGLFACGAMALTIAGLAIEWSLWNQPSLAAQWLRYYWFRLADIAVPLALASLLIAALQELLDRRSRLAPLMLAVTLAMTGQWLGEKTYHRYLNPSSASEKKTPSIVAWREACQWVREESPHGSLFLTPRTNQTFKWHGERAEVVIYKDVPQDATSLIEWHHRLYDVHKPSGIRSLPWCRSLGQLGTPRILALAGRYQFHYVLTRTGYPLELPIAYQNQKYIIYRVPTVDAP